MIEKALEELVRARLAKSNRPFSEECVAEGVRRAAAELTDVVERATRPARARSEQALLDSLDSTPKGRR